MKRVFFILLIIILLPHCGVSDKKNDSKLESGFVNPPDSYVSAATRLSARLKRVMMVTLNTMFPSGQTPSEHKNIKMSC